MRASLFFNASIPFCRLRSSGFLDQRPAAIAPGQTNTGCFTRIPGGHFQTIGLRAHPGRRSGRSCPYTGAFRAHHHAGGMGKRVKTGVEYVVKRTWTRLRRFRMAGRLCSIFREPIQSRASEAIYRRTRGASSQDWISRRTARIATKARIGMGRKIYLGLKLTSRANAGHLRTAIKHAH